MCVPLRVLNSRITTIKVGTIPFKLSEIFMTRGYFERIILIFLFCDIVLQEAVEMKKYLRVSNFFIEQTRYQYLRRPNSTRKLNPLNNAKNDSQTALNTVIMSVL